VTDVERLIGEVILESSRIRVGAEAVFFEAGLTSVMLLAVHVELQRRLGREFPVTAFFKYPTTRSLAGFLAAAPEAAAPPRRDPGLARGLSGARRALRAQLMDRKD
jgi:acyl carrier protein